MNSKVGHTLYWTFRQQVTAHTIIAQGVDHKGTEFYVLDWWNKDAKTFVKIYANSYFIGANRIKIVAERSLLEASKTTRYMAQAWRIMEMLKLVNKRLRAVRPGVSHYQQIQAITGYRGKWDMQDMSRAISLDSDSEYFFGNPAEKAKLMAKRNRLHDMLGLCMSLAGIWEAKGFKKADKQEFETWLDTVATA